MKKEIYVMSLNEQGWIKMRKKLMFKQIIDWIDNFELFETYIWWRAFK